MLQDSLLVTTTSSTLACSLAQLHNSPLMEMSIDHFSDGEVCIKQNQNYSFTGKNIFLIHTFSFLESQDINSQIFDFLALVSEIKRCGASKITALLPYLPYSRQDSRSGNIVIGLMTLFVDLAKTAGVDHIFCCDVHNPNILSDLSLSITNISLDSFWAAHAKDGIEENIVFISPDQGGYERVRTTAQHAGVSYRCLTKERVGKNKTRTFSLDSTMHDTAIICDDIINTGSTAVDAAQVLVASGAKKVVGFFTHAVLSYDDIARIEQSDFSWVLVSDSINMPEKKLSNKISVTSLDSYLVQFFKENFLHEK